MLRGGRLARKEHFAELEKVEWEGAPGGRRVKVVFGN
jgi:hypothetical protein